MPDYFLRNIRDAARIALLSASVVTSAAAQRTPTAARDSLTLAVSAGWSATCAIRGSRRVQCWGSNEDGQIGIGREGGVVRTPTYVHAPIGDPAAHTIAINAASGDFVCGVIESGALYCWGAGAWGQIGVGTPEAYPTVPTRAAGTIAFTSVSGGDRFACGLARSEAVYCWGGNEYGQLGTDDTLSHFAPTPVAGGIRFRLLTAGADATPCGIAVDSLAYCWGDARGGLGTGDTINRRAPTRVATDRRFIDIAAGSDYTCAVSIGHQVFCWGLNQDGELGLPLSVARTDRPTTPVPGDARYLAVSAGSFTTCGLTTERRILCWGNEAGPGGRGAVGDSTPIPQPLASNERFRALSVGGGHACAITVQNILYCWSFRRSVPERF